MEGHSFLTFLKIENLNLYIASNSMDTCSGNYLCVFRSLTISIKLKDSTILFKENTQDQTPSNLIWDMILRQSSPRCISSNVF